MSRRWKSIEKESRFVVAGGCGGQYDFLELDSGDGCIHSEYAKNNELHSNMVNFMPCGVYLKVL